MFHNNAGAYYLIHKFTSVVNTKNNNCTAVRCDNNSFLNIFNSKLNILTA